MDMKTEIQNAFNNLPEEVRELIPALSVICSDGLSSDVACNIIMPDQPKQFFIYVHSLNEFGWLILDNNNIYTSEAITEVALEECPLTDDKHKRLLTTLQKHINLKPLDDMYAKREYFKAARVYLCYLMATWKDDIVSKPQELIKAFVYNVVYFAKNAELGFYDVRTKTVTVEQRIDYMLLNYVVNIDASYPNSEIHILLGELSQKIFRYKDAKDYFSFAISFEEVNKSMLRLAVSKMYFNLSIFWKALQYAYEAYEENEKANETDLNLYVCLHIAYICAYSDSPENTKFWLQKFWQIMRGRSIPKYHLFSIKLKEIEAILLKDDLSQGMTVADSAELETYQLYGANSPELANIYGIRSYLEGEAEKNRQGVKYYSKYVDINHFNYGNCAGDVAMLYSAMIFTHTSLGNSRSCDVYTRLLEQLDTDNDNFSPGVRIGQAQAKFYTYLFAYMDTEKAKEYLQLARDIYEKELMPNDEVFFKNKDKILPFATESSTIITSNINNDNNVLEYFLYYIQGDTDRAKRYLKTLIDAEENPLQKLKWMVKLGNVLAAEENQAGANEIWKEVLDNADKKDIFSLSVEISKCAEEHGMMQDALDYIDIALQYDNMIFANNQELATALSSQAELRKYYNFENPEEEWRQAESLLKSLNDTDGLSSLYFSWSYHLYDSEKVQYIRKAIRLWEPEQGQFDERLAIMYHTLTIALGAIGNFNEARQAARKAVEHFPFDYPPELHEEIKEFL